MFFLIAKSVCVWVTDSTQTWTVLHGLSEMSLIAMLWIPLSVAVYSTIMVILKEPESGLTEPYEIVEFRFCMLERIRKPNKP